MKRFARYLLPVALFAALSLDIVRSADILRAQRLVRAVEGRTLSMMQSGKMQRSLLLSHVAALEDARRLDPAEVAIRVALGSEHFLLGDFAAARAAYDDALALEPRPEIYLNYGKTWHAEGEEERALSYFARAIKLDPSLAREVPESARKILLDPLGGQHDPDRPKKN